MAQVGAEEFDLEAYRTAREFEHVTGRFAESLARSKIVEISALRAQSAALSMSVLRCAHAETNAAFEAARADGLGSRQECYDLLDRFCLTRQGSYPERTAAIEMAERVHSVLLGLQAKPRAS